MTKRLILALILSYSPLWATTYYVDNCVTVGSDRNNGTSTSTPWLTINKVNTSKFNPGDSILFESTCTWREQLTVPSSGSAGSPITFGAYGTGAQPIINGATLITPGSSWSNAGSNTWSAAVTTQPNVVAFNGVIGTNVASQALCVSAGEWYWASNVLYVYSTSSPDTVYTNPGVESGARSAAVLTSSKSYVTVTGINAKFTNGAAIVVSGGTGVIVAGNSLYGTDEGILGEDQTANLTISNNTVSYTTQAGICTYLDSNPYSVSGLTITGNEVDHSGMYGIDISYLQASSPLLIEYNFVNVAAMLGTGNQGIGVLGGSNPYTGTGIVAYNVVCCVAWNGAGILVDTEMIGLQIYGNISYGNQGGGIGVWQSSGVKVYNNTIYNNGNTGTSAYGGCLSVGGIGGGRNSLLKNNICLSNSKNVFVDSDATTTGLVIDYNLYGNDGASMFNWKGTNYNFASWKTNSSQDGDSPTLADPKLANPTGLQFWLATGSPAIDAGSNLGSPYNIGLMPGSTWPNSVVTGDQNAYGSGWEIGAFIYVPPVAPASNLQVVKVN